MIHILLSFKFSVENFPSFTIIIEILEISLILWFLMTTAFIERIIYGIKENFFQFIHNFVFKYLKV